MAAKLIVAAFLVGELESDRVLDAFTDDCMRYAMSGTGTNNLYDLSLPVNGNLPAILEDLTMGSTAAAVRKEILDRIGGQ